MSLKNTTTAWGWPARVLHWVMALMILAMLGVGTYMANFEKDLIARLELVQTHKSVGFTVFILALIRIGWRLANRDTPALPPAMPRWQKAASHASHLALYLLMLALPLSGWLMASSSPLNDEGAYPMRIPNMVFGLFEMPDPFPVGSKALSDALYQLHGALALALELILLVHLGAALKHHFVDGDTVLSRMVSGRGQR
ncbi:cytochrome b [Oceanibium sediminis]|uniref:cytochrome b n=1 Tax=Oceanibium sediminis TaxID=2026339 RepID=UPI000DD47393|nr:cytochrome b [Oceanibium sediminis]